MRKLFLLCLIIFSVQAVAQTPRDPRESISDAIADMDRAFSRNDFIPQDEYFLGRAVAANILANYRPYTAYPDLTRYLNLICHSIVVNSVQPTIFKNYYVMILDSPEFNAFSTPGGHIFLTRGLVELAASEDMLAAVIAHELVHIMLRHSISAIENMRFRDDMARVSDRASTFAGNIGSVNRITNFRNSVSDVIDMLTRNGYSRTQEFEADREAAALLAATGYDPMSLIEMLHILQQVQSTQAGGFNTTHPSPRERITSVEATARHYQVEDTRSYRTQRFNNR